MATSGFFDLVGRCYRMTLSGRPAIQLAGEFCLDYYVFPISNTGSKKCYLWKKYDWLKIDFSFITGNFLGIWDRLCMEPMRGSHDFLSLILAIVGSTSGSCYFLLQCRCLSVCVLCILVVTCVKV